MNLARAASLILRLDSSKERPIHLSSEFTYFIVGLSVFLFLQINIFRRVPAPRGTLSHPDTLSLDEKLSTGCNFVRENFARKNLAELLAFTTSNSSLSKILVRNFEGERVTFSLENLANWKTSLCERWKKFLTSLKLAAQYFFHKVTID